MTNLLDDLVINKITLEEVLQRLLIVANRIDNKELAKWCTLELNGYEKYEDLPEYRKCKSPNIVYSGINGRLQITNQPLGPGYLKSETISEIENVGIFENIADVLKKSKSEQLLYRDMTMLAGEVYKNTFNGITGVQCTSIRQMMPQDLYSDVYSAVKTRVINLLCSFEKAKIKLNKVDLKINNRNENTINENQKLYKAVIIEGKTYNPNFKKENKILWQVIVPLVTAVGAGLLVYLITNVWIK